MSGRDVVLTYTTATWDDAQRRGMCRGPDRLFQTLLDHPRVARVMLVNPFRSLPIRIGRRALGRREHPFPHSERAFLCRPHRLRRRDPEHVAAIEHAYRVYDTRIARAAAAAGFDRPAVITMSPLVAGFSPLRWAGPVTFYANDDWAEYYGYRRWWRAIDEAYRRVSISGRALCAVSQAIIDRIAPVGPYALVPNGIDPGEWFELSPPPEWLEALPRPRALYVGTLDRRLDVPGLVRTAEAFGEGSIALVGPEADPGILAPLRRMHNVHIRPPVPRDEVAALIRAADVCLLPHMRSPLTEAMSPLKLYEYLAAGRPVAATDLEPVRGVSARVVLVPHGGDFAAAVAGALARGPAPETERVAFLEEHAWRRRHERIIAMAFREAASASATDAQADSRAGR